MRLGYRTGSGIDGPCPQPDGGVAPQAAERARTHGGLLLTDLFQPLGALPGLVAEAVENGDWLDAFLLGAAGAQVAEDAMGGAMAGTGRWWWWAQLSNELDAPGWARQAVLSTARSFVAAAARVAERSARGRALAAAADTMAALRDAAAPVAAGLTERPDADMGPLLEAAAAAVGRLAAADGSEPLRLPSSLRSFDQYPEDVGELVRRAGLRWPDRSRPVVVVGLRTSGSYLAPLAAAYLRAQGFEDVAVATVRPGVTPTANARRALAKVTDGPGLAMLFDDPPASGRSIAKAAAQLERMGAPPDALLLLLALAGPDGVPGGALERYPTVLLEWPDWHVHRLLEPSRVAGVLEHFASGCQVVSCLSRPQPVSWRRGHVRARYDVVLLPAGSGVVEPAELVVEGAGIGLFGRHVVAVSDALGVAVAPMLGFVDGLGFRLEPPGGWRAPDVNGPGIAGAVATYVEGRRKALPAAEDRTQVMGGRLPVWEAVSRVLAPGLGRPEPLLRVAVLGPFARRLLASPRPSVVDGCMSAANWYQDGDRLVKGVAATGAFSNFDLACYDALYDMAAAAAEADLAELAEEAEMAAGGPGARPVGALARGGAEIYAQAWKDRAGDVPDQERWLAYRLVHLWDMRRRGELGWELWGRACSRAVNSYMAAVYLAGVGQPAALGETSTPCALDIDGCLEGGALGFSAVTAPSALALRALRAHGVPVLLATGRSLGETVERCAVFGLEGASAEYGTVAYRVGSAMATPVASAAEMDAMRALRHELSERDDVEVSPFHRYSVRAREAGNGPGRRLSAERLGDLGDQWDLVAGYNQTDIVPAGADKLNGLCALSGRGRASGEETNRPGADVPREERGWLSLAVGDTRSDMAMLRAARLGVAPANCDDELRRSGVRVARAAHQAGVAEAVGTLLGHRPGTCSLCQAPRMPASRRVLVGLLSAQSAGRRRAVPLVVELVRALGLVVRG